MKKIGADYLFTGNSTPIKNGVVVVDENGTIQDVLNPIKETINWDDVEKYEGIICPGFINAHCHLELSYLKGKLTEKTQLPGFVKEIIEKRDAFTFEEKKHAIQLAEQEMIQNGIVAVGDISNGDNTFLTKEESKLEFHTFVEVFGSDPKIANEAFDHSKKLYDQYFDKSRTSITPHATYSVSDKLTSLINEHSVQNNGLISIHNQETASENGFFRDGTGAMFDFLDIQKKMNNQYQPTSKNALASFLGKYVDLKKVLLIHNTYTNQEDIDWATRYSDEVYWCFCPNANLFIENALPDFDLFVDEKCTLGTDSLASNWSLSILDEMKVITKANRSIPLEKLIQWSSSNGAQFFGFDQLGSIELGKTPGINLITNISELRLTSDSEIKKLF